MKNVCASAGYSRSGSCFLVVWLAAACVAACATMEPAVPLPPITLRLQDGARWIEPADLPRYQCELGSLICTSTAGRLTTRLCRCVASPDDLAKPPPPDEIAR